MSTAACPAFGSAVRFSSTVSRRRPPQSGIKFQGRDKRPLWPDHFLLPLLFQHYRRRSGHCQDGHTQSDIR